MSIEPGLRDRILMSLVRDSPIRSNSPDAGRISLAARRRAHDPGFRVQSYRDHASSWNASDGSRGRSRVPRRIGNFRSAFAGADRGRHPSAASRKRAAAYLQAHVDVGADRPALALVAPALRHCRRRRLAVWPRCRRHESRPCGEPLCPEGGSPASACSRPRNGVRASVVEEESTGNGALKDASARLSGGRRSHPGARK